MISGCDSGAETGLFEARDRTIKVVSTRDDSPIADVEVELKAIGKAFGEDGPAYDKQVWNLTTDSAGEIFVRQPAISTLYVNVWGKEGYRDARETIKFYEKARKYFKREPAEASWKDTYYLTPNVDANYEYVRWAYRVVIDVVDGRVQIPTQPMPYLAYMYSKAKARAKTERELLALRAFCGLADQMKVELANGGPTLTTDYIRDLGKQLVDDCAADRRDSCRDLPHGRPRRPRRG